jgi:hypothetical protein
VPLVRTETQLFNMFSQLDLEKLRPLFSSPLSITSAIVLVFVAVFYLPRFSEKSSVPFYTEGDSTLKKRWMFDGISLLREGYNKVCKNLQGAGH